jgi:hypothetical protein
MCAVSLRNRFPATFTPSFRNPYGSATPWDPAPNLYPDTNFIFSPFLTFGSLASNFKSSAVQSWNLTLERRMAHDLLVRAAYVGTVATQLMTSEALNPAVYAPGGSTIANTNDRRIYTGLGNITEIRNGARSAYHSWQLTLQRRFSKGFSFSSNYTLSKSIDTSSKAQDGGVTEGPNPFNRMSNRALSDFDTTHNFNTSFIWALPFFNNSSGLARVLLHGWQITGIVNLQSGIPFAVTDSRDIGFAGIGAGVRSDLAGNPFLPTNRSRNDLVAEYFETTAFKQPADGTFGSAGRNLIRGPGLFNVDSSVIKDFRLQERLTLQFRAEFFNLFNQVNFDNPVGNLNAASIDQNGRIVNPGDFGRITSVSNNPRLIQFALKLNF